jgi:hypothetical protein
MTFEQFISKESENLAGWLTQTLTAKEAKLYASDGLATVNAVAQFESVELPDIPVVPKQSPTYKPKDFVAATEGNSGGTDGEKFATENYVDQAIRDALGKLGIEAQCSDGEVTVALTGV